MDTNPAGWRWVLAAAPVGWWGLGFLKSRMQFDWMKIQ